jgi:hypothetical protein
MPAASSTPLAVVPKSEADSGQADTDSLLTLLGDQPDESQLLPIRQRRLNWAALLRRVFALDVLQCPECDGRMVVLAAINDPAVAQKILAHLGLPTCAPRCAPARAPPDPEFDFDTDPDEAYDTDYWDEEDID